MNRLSALLPLALAAFTPRGAPAAEPAPAPPAQVRTLRSTAPGAAQAGGAWVAASVAAVERATLSTRVAATAKAVHVQEGQRVARGQLVVSLSDADLRGAVAAARSALDAASAHERRTRNLLSERAATPAELEQATTQRAQAEAAVAAAQANLDYAQLRAPFAGTVQARRVDPGDLVGPGQPLLVLEGDALELQASLSEAEGQGLALGAPVRFQADAIAGTAVVTALTPGGDPVTHRRTLRARVQQAPGLRSGAFARLEVPGAGAGATPGAVPAAHAWVPRSALVERGDLTGVFVAAAGKAELRWIAVGEPAGDGVQVRAGLRAGDQVIDAPGALRDGQRVEVLP
jgi:RND family efflux transporter MFP subunit